MKKFLLLLIFVLGMVGCEKDKPIICPTDPHIVDGSGNFYDVIVTGNQVWLNKNVRADRLNDNSGLSYMTREAKPAYQLNNAGDYLYNYYAVTTGKLCPKGFKIPTIKDFEELHKTVSELGSAEVIRNYYMTYWRGVASGSCDPGGNISNTDIGMFWSNTEDSENKKQVYYMFFKTTESVVSTEQSIEKGAGLSVRCIQER